MQNVHFSPPQLARLFAVNVSTIKRWVDRGLLPSERTAGGHRRVHQEHLAAFVTKFPMYAARSYTLRRLAKTPGIQATSWEQYYQLLQKNQVQKAELCIERAYVQSVPIAKILDTLIVPALRQIGVAWAAGGISIYEEHRMTFIIRMALLRLDQYIPERANSRSPSAILACVPGEHHELPLQMLALLLKQNGWNRHILGINIPLPELRRAIHDIRPKIVGLTKTYREPHSIPFLKSVERTCAQHHSSVLIGGNGWPTSHRQKYGKTMWVDDLQSFSKIVLTKVRKKPK